METVKQVIMKRDGISEDEADDLIAAFTEEFDATINEWSLDDGDVLDQLDAAEELVREHFGLEPDYVEQFLYRI